MKKNVLLILTTIVLILSIPVTVFAGNEGENTSTEQSQVSVRRPVRFHASWHYGVNYLQIRNLSSINSKLEEAELSPISSDLVLTHWQYALGEGRGWRFGWINFKGKQSQLGPDEEKTKYGVEMKGVYLEKGVYSDRTFDIGLGGVIGYGKNQLDLLFETPDEVFSPTGMHLNQNFAFLSPQINARASVFSILDLKAQAGYFLSIGKNKWDVAGEEASIPRVKIDGWQLGIALGVRF